MSLISGIGSILGGVLGYVGQREANRTNRQIAREATGVNVEEAKKDREFQERMSSTAFQRGMRDMKAAGLNPILAYNKGGASTPGGAAGSGVTAQVQNPLDKVVSTALEVKRFHQDLKNLRKTEQVLDSQAQKNRMETKVMSKEIPKAELINRAYDRLEPLINKILPDNSSSAVGTKKQIQQRRNLIERGIELRSR